MRIKDLLIIKKNLQIWSSKLQKLLNLSLCPVNKTNLKQSNLWFLINLFIYLLKYVSFTFQTKMFLFFFLSFSLTTSEKLTASKHPKNLSRTRVIISWWKGKRRHNFVYFMKSDLGEFTRNKVPEKKNPPKKTRN